MAESNIEAICCGHAAYDLNFFVDEYPREDEKYKIDRLIQTGGGPAANAASLLAKWGVSTAYAGLLGDDIYGRLITEELLQWKVDISLVETDIAKNTPLSAVIVNTTSGSRTLLNRRDECDQPAVTAAVSEKLERMKPALLHFDGHAPDLSLEMIRRYPEAAVVMDAGSFREAADTLCRQADYAICSRRYAAECTGIEDLSRRDNRLKCIETLRSLYPGRVVVTMGSEGLFYGDDRQGAVSVKAFPADAVDSTGAGDIFHAAFSYSVLRGYSFENGLRLASAAAALSVCRPGAKTSIPGLEESLRLAENGMGI